MTSEEFRTYAHEAVDWMADYFSHPENYPPIPRIQPGELIDALPCCGPEKGEPMSAILEDFRTKIVPAGTNWQHPGVLAYFPASASGAGILGEMLAAAMNMNGMAWLTSPAVVELEQVALAWLRRWIHLPDDMFGMIFDSASVSTMHAIAAAREMAAPQARAEGNPGDLVLYTSEQSHYSVEKGAMTLGLGQKNVRRIAVDDQFRMRPDALAAAMARDRQDGLRPFCVVATVGTTCTSSIDPVDEIADVAGPYGAWLHVDAAYAGAAAIAPEFRHTLRGVDRADSFVVNPHKWLFTPVDISAFYTRRPEVLRRAFSLNPQGSNGEDAPRVVNFMEYGVPLGRRFRALKLWFVLRHHGREGIAEIIRHQIGWAQELGRQVDAEPRFERVAPTPFSTVCFRLKGTNEENHMLLKRVNASGEVLLSSTVLNGRYCIRVAILNMSTTREHVQRAWELVRAHAS